MIERFATTTLVVLALASCAPANTGTSSGEGEGEGEGEGTAAFVYEEIDGAVCANGTPTGLGVSTVASSTLAVFVNGGGACWDSFSCFGANAAVDLSVTYSDAQLQAELAPVASTGLLDRGDDTNPLAHVSIAFIPYCTADLHDGDAERDYQADVLGQDIRHIHHAGRTNAALFATALAAQFPDVTEVLLFGASAGGYGAVLSDDLYVAAFPNARVDLLVDGAPFVPPQNGLYFTWQSQWNMAIPACTDCDTNFAKIVENQRLTQPDRRFALITSTNDETIRLFFGYGLNDMTPFVDDLVTKQYSFDNAKAFELTSTQHVLLTGYSSITAADGTTLKSFFDGWVRGDVGYKTTRP